MMRVLLAILTMIGAAQPAVAQKSKPADDEPIVVKGLADGARVVTVDFDKVWKTCAECKRALKKLDKLARNYRDELKAAGHFASSGAVCANGPASTVSTFQRSSADVVGEPPRGGGAGIVNSLCTARAEDRSRQTFDAMAQKYAAPEQARLVGYMRSFLDQLTPHIYEATEAERIAHDGSAGLVDTKRTKLSARNVKRIDVTNAVIRRLDAMTFTIDLPDPPPPGPARGGYEPIR